MDNENQERDDERNLGTELDALKNEFNTLKESLAQLTRMLGAMPPMGMPPIPVPPMPVLPIGGAPHNQKLEAGYLQKMPGMHPDPDVQAVLDKVENDCIAKKSTGSLSYVGVFTSGGRQSTWARHQMNTDDLISPLMSSGIAQRVLDCIGSNERLKILLALLQRPMTVAQLVETCGYNSTGQVYHHINPLISANIVAEDAVNAGKGVYVVVPSRVQGIIMILAGISDLIDPLYAREQRDAPEKPL